MLIFTTVEHEMPARVKDGVETNTADAGFPVGERSSIPIFHPSDLNGSYAREVFAWRKVRGRTALTPALSPRERERTSSGFDAEDALSQWTLQDTAQKLGPLLVPFASIRCTPSVAVCCEGGFIRG